MALEYTTPDGYKVSVVDAPTPDGTPKRRTLVDAPDGTHLIDLPHDEAGTLGEYMHLAGTSALVPDPDEAAPPQEPTPAS